MVLGKHERLFQGDMPPAQYVTPIQGHPNTEQNAEN